MMPMVTPTVMKMTAAKIVSASVLGKRVKRISPTGRPVRKENPRHGAPQWTTSPA